MFLKRKINKNKKVRRFSVGVDRASENFNRIDDYSNAVKEFIYTDINILYEDNDDPRVIQSRVQHLVSATLIRSLLLKDGVVDALNRNNVAAAFAVIKSFIETAGVLGYILDLLKKELDNDELLDNLIPLAIGNKDAGSLSVTSGVDAINVKTMLSKLDRHMANLFDLHAEQKVVIEVLSHDAVVSDLYGVICNYGHPNYSSHELSGDLNTEGLSEGV